MVAAGLLPRPVNPGPESTAIQSRIILVPLSRDLRLSGNELEWNVQLRSGFDRDHELSSPILLDAAVITADGSLRHAAVPASASFLLETRAEVTVKNKSMVTGVRSATVSGVLAVETVGV